MEQKIGILFKSAESLEILHLVDTVVLDKTGTVTEGKPRVTDILSKLDEKEVLKIAGSLEKNSEHPLAKAIIQYADEKQIELEEIKDFKSIPGRGVKGEIHGEEYFGGNIYFMEENGIDIKHIEGKEDLLSEGKTVLYFANSSDIIGIIAVADKIKETSVTAVEELKRQGLEVVMLTGDNKVVSDRIGKELKINKVI